VPKADIRIAAKGRHSITRLRDGGTDLGFLCRGALCRSQVKHKFEFCRALDR